MPIYEYLCDDCGTKFEKLVRRSVDGISVVRKVTVYGIAGRRRSPPATALLNLLLRHGVARLLRAVLHVGLGPQVLLSKFGVLRLHGRQFGVGLVQGIRRVRSLGRFDFFRSGLTVEGRFDSWRV